MFEEFLPLQHCAAICHQANKILCEHMGDKSQLDWEYAPDWQKTTVIDGVKAIRDGLVTTPEESHIGWVKHKLDDGWIFGDAKNCDLKTHPNLIPYSQLSEDQKVKDRMFFNIVKQFFASHPEFSDELS